MHDLMFGVALAGAVTTGLVAGIFFAFSFFMMQSLDRLGAGNATAAMQSINETIQNPMFFLVLLGSGAISLGAIPIAIKEWGESGANYLLIGGILCFVGSIVVTLAFNVPLNDRLAGVVAGSADGDAMWKTYLVDWTRWNHVRTVSTIIAMTSFILAARNST